MAIRVALVGDASDEIFPEATDFLVSDEGDIAIQRQDVAGNTLVVAVVARGQWVYAVKQ